MKHFRQFTFFLLSGLMFAIATPTRAQYDAGRALQFLQATYNQHDKKLTGYLITELQNFIATFPEDEKAPEAMYLLAQTYTDNNKKPLALATYLKALHLYPNSNRQRECREAALKLLATDKKFAKFQEKLSATIQGEFSGETLEERYGNYLAFLAALDESRVYDLVISETRRFIQQFPQSQQIDKMLLTKADFYFKKGKAREAAASYGELVAVTPESPLLAQAQFRQAEIYYKKLKEYPKAQELFTQITADYLGSQYAAQAQFMLGELKSDKLKDYPGSIVAYRTFLENYPNDENAAAALFAIAKIYASKLKNYPEAIAAYQEIAEKFPADPRGIEALAESAKIYEKQLDDFAKAAEQYALAAEKYPEHEKAPDLLFKAAKLYEKKLQDTEKARQYYQELLDKYPGHKRAKDAAKRLEKM